MNVHIDATTVPLIDVTIKEAAILKRRIGYVHLAIMSTFLGGLNATVAEKAKMVMSKNTNHHSETIIDQIIVESALVRKIMDAMTGSVLPVTTTTSLSERNATGVESQSREVEDVIPTKGVDSVVEEILIEEEDEILTEGVDSVVEEILTEGEEEIPIEEEDVILIDVADSVAVEILIDAVDVMDDRILVAVDRAVIVEMIGLMSVIEKHVGSDQDTLITEGHNLFALADIKAEIETIEVKARDSRITLS
ncbi:MAG: hypothetical protein QGG62_03130 [Candidatus Poseidoniaceae archaeon]|nr:hypothetical protein [Candidatus Poseidoniaceae archaeon]